MGCLQFVDLSFQPGSNDPQLLLCCTRLRLILPTPLIFCWTVAHAKNHVASTGTHHCFALAFYYVIIGLLGIALCHCNISKLNAIELNFNLLVAVVAHVCNNGLELVSL